LKAKKHFGQHFLRDQCVIDRIMLEIGRSCSMDMPLLEIGPGQGALSVSLARHYPEFVALEIDRDMMAVLSPLLPEGSLMFEDFLKADLPSLFEGRPFNLVGNFPYNISSQIIFKMIEHVDRIPQMVGMFQKELAERVCSGPGTKANGVISILSQAYYETEILFTIGPQSFDPPPKVESAVISLRRKEASGPECDYKLFRRVVKQAFQQRRKKMRNTLKSFNIDTENPIFQKRPEELGVADFVNIVNGL